MANLKDLFSAYDSSTLEFRNNAEAAADGTMWANAFVKDSQDRLICIGATVDTLNKIKAEPTMSNLMLTSLEKKVAKESGNEYYMCQLAIAKPADFSFSTK
jgi:hypothetical protein